MIAAAVIFSSQFSRGMVLSPGKLTSPVIVTCSYERLKCLKVAAQKAYIGSLGNLMVMLNANYEINDSAARKHTFGKAEKVTLDFNLNRVVFTKKNRKGDLVETAVSLANFQSTKYVTGP